MLNLSSRPLPPRVLDMHRRIDHLPGFNSDSIESLLSNIKHTSSRERLLCQSDENPVDRWVASSLIVRSYLRLAKMPGQGMIEKAAYDRIYQRLRGQLEEKCLSNYDREQCFQYLLKSESYSPSSQSSWRMVLGERPSSRKLTSVELLQTTNFLERKGLDFYEAKCHYYLEHSPENHRIPFYELIVAIKEHDQNIRILSSHRAIRLIESMERHHPRKTPSTESSRKPWRGLNCFIRRWSQY